MKERKLRVPRNRSAGYADSAWTAPFRHPCCRRRALFRRRANHRDDEAEHKQQRENKKHEKASANAKPQKSPPSDSRACRPRTTVNWWSRFVVSNRRSTKAKHRHVCVTYTAVSTPSTHQEGSIKRQRVDLPHTPPPTLSTLCVYYPQVLFVIFSPFFYSFKHFFYSFLSGSFIPIDLPLSIKNSFSSSSTFFFNY